MEEALSIAAVRRVLASYTPVREPELGRAASVLVPLFERAGRLHVLLTKRAADLPTHAGQISFPGGKREPSDTSARATALRETHEEIGLGASQVEIIGELDDCPTFVSSFVITPIVGVIPDGVAFVRSRDEVEFLLELPLGDFLLPDALRKEQVERGGHRIELHYYTVKGHVVWGATARILAQLFELITHEAR